MKDYFFFELNLFMKQKKTTIFAVTLIIFLISIIIAITFEGLGDEEKKLAEDLTQTRIVTQQVQNYSADDEETSNFIENLYLQQNLIASKSNGITFNNDSWFIDSGIKLAELRHSMLGNELFNGMPDSLLPQEDVILRELVELEEIQNQSVPVQVNLKSATGVLKSSLFYFGYLAFFFTLVFGSNIMTDDFNHSSMVESYPVNRLRKIFIKLFINSFSIMGIIVLILLIMCIILSFIWDFGDLSYPTGVYLFGSFKAIPFWFYILLFSFYYFILIMHALVLSMVLNLVLKNTMATILVGLILFITPYLYNPSTNYFVFLPFHYYNITSLFNGTFATKISPNMHIGLGSIILIIYMIFLIVLIVHIQKRNIKTGGYQYE